MHSSLLIIPMTTITAILVSTTSFIGSNHTLPDLASQDSAFTCVLTTASCVISTKTDGDGIGMYKCCDDTECASPANCVASADYSSSCSDGGDNLRFVFHRFGVHNTTDSRTVLISCISYYYG